MPDLGNLSHSSSLSLSRCPHLKLLSIDSADSANAFDPGAIKTLALNCGWAQGLVRKGADCNGNGIRGLKRVKKGSNGKVLGDYLRDWVQSKMESGIPESGCVLPFLVGAKKSVCFVCRQRTQWRCVCCSMASHNKCAPWPDAVTHLEDKPGRAICWRHPTNWRLDKKHAVPATEIEEIFCQLPLPYKDEEFKLDLTWRDLMENKLEPPPYVHIKRNVYLVKKKRDDADDDIGCTSCSSDCSEDCVCRVQCISCSKACRCPETCTNRPFRKEKKIRIVKTELCGWGVEAAEPINKGDFVIEYIGEVIDDAQCEKRLWDMKYKGVKNFYMCEIRKDFTIDATFKGNTSRFLNHSCDPNCVLEKWQVEGETRVGVFAARSIEVGEPLTYDYRFVQFGPEVKCYCGSSNCQGYLGTKRKIVKLDLSWGSKRRRSSAACLAIITV
ncbi:PREDICTED: histone-lysine N-methyltransferase ASHR3 isoform X2 [Theobroma cacao]|uniref:Histone-lysine N-methyltransferase ASHR3 isoform X2 n=1 Tax=Theobroma cacao TaxID=3641 RepID=A0AB32WVL6_THECC|nr:PREDICTED: histone-lysine N-methyltransferase ASHR3 isoform X2 [Theobroma cacao]